MIIIEQKGYQHKHIRIKRRFTHNRGLRIPTEFVSKENPPMRVSRKKNSP